MVTQSRHTYAGAPALLRVRARRAAVASAVLATICLPVAAAPALAASADRSESLAWASLFASDRPVQVADTQRVVVLFDAPSLATWTSAGDTPLSPQSERRFVREAMAQQDSQLGRTRAAGIDFTVLHRYVRVVNGVALELHGDDVEALRRVQGVRSVSQARATYPTQRDVSDVEAATAAAAGVAAGQERPAATVAVLDTGIDFNHPVLRGRQAGPGYDVLADQVGVDPSGVEDHGTQVAGGVTLGDGDTRILPVRVLAAQPVIGGLEAVIGTSDALLAGFEIAVDPDRDGSTDDRVDVALAAVTEPYAGFAGSPEEQAVDGADALGVLTVAAAGNDGASGDGIGTVGAPASARSALAVGAVDLRVETRLVDVHARGGLLDTVFIDTPLLTRATELPGGAVPVVVVDGVGDDVVDYLGTDVRSRVAGAAALVTRRDDVLVADQVRAAADAGAVAILVADAGSVAAAGVIDAPGADIPAIGLGGDASTAIRDAAASSRVEVDFAHSESSTNSTFGSVAGFSARGPRHDGIGKPDVLAAGVAVTTTGAGLDADGRERYQVVSGTSIAAARVAGQAAGLRARHPEWSPATVRAALLGTASLAGSPGDRAPIEAQGAGVVDIARASAVGVVARPGRLDAGAMEPGQSVRLPLDFVNLSDDSRVATPQLTVESSTDTAGIALALDGASVVVTVGDQVAPGVHGGWLAADSLGLRIPWTIAVRAPGDDDVPIGLELSDDRFRPSIGAGRYASTLKLSIGGSSHDDSLGLRAASRVEVRLVRAAGPGVAGGAVLGTVGSLEQVLPGIYSFGVSGYAVGGDALKPGSYDLRVRYVSSMTPRGAWRSGPQLRFTITR